MKLTDKELAVRVETAIETAVSYFIIQKKQVFTEFEDDLNHLLTVLLDKVPGFNRVSLKLHPNIAGDYFDIGIVFDEISIALRLVELMPGKTVSKTMH